MAEYTIELKDVVENHNIFDFSYPFYDPLKRLEFEKRFIRHFYFREIGCPTIDRFKVYLEDKMNTVFPYYNKLMETATIDYDIMDNYRLKETYTRNVERKEHGSGISSTVGKVYDEQTSESNQNKTVDNVGKATVDGVDKQIEKGNSKTVSVETVDNDTTANTTTTTENKKVSKFLDTPQGQLDLTDSKYLTTLTQDNDNGTNTTNGSGTNDTVKDAETTTDNSRTADTTSKETTDTTGKETTADKVEVKTNQEQRTTNDNNTRTFSNGETKEEYTIERRGNIGVDTDSDGIMKHIKLQKVLQEIEKMFFDECEDLFMLVY